MRPEPFGRGLVLLGLFPLIESIPVLAGVSPLLNIILTVVGFVPLIGAKSQLDSARLPRIS